MTEENSKVKERPMPEFRPMRGQVVRTVQDKTGLSEAEIRFHKKTGKFFAHVNDIEYTCEEIKPLEMLLKGLLVTLRDIWFFPVISIEAYKPSDKWGEGIVSPEKPGYCDVVHGECGFGYARFYMGQNKHTFRTYTLDWDRAEGIMEGAKEDGVTDREEINQRFQTAARVWPRPKKDGKEILEIPLEVVDSWIMGYSTELWETLEEIVKSIGRVNDKLVALLIPDRLLEMAASGEIPLLKEKT